jgi:hypothetical protein
MTPDQQERLKNKIRLIKAFLTEDKRRLSGSHQDERGLRYTPPRLYIQLGDYSGGLRYFNWFNKNFPGDFGYPHFLFEWTVILFKIGKLREAEKKAFQTFTRNTYLFDKFFDRPIKPIDKWEGSNLEGADFALHSFTYSHQQDHLSDFAAWLDEFIHSEKFLLMANTFIDIQKRLKTAHDFRTPRDLAQQADTFEEEM